MVLSAMISTITLIQLAAAACSSTSPIKAGDVAPCSGMLWSIEATKKAVSCKLVEIPKLKADYELKLSTCNANLDKFKIRATLAESIIKSTPNPPAAWVLPVTVGGSMIAGVLLGILATSAF